MFKILWMSAKWLELTEALSSEECFYRVLTYASLIFSSPGFLDGFYVVLWLFYYFKRISHVDFFFQVKIIFKRNFQKK